MSQPDVPAHDEDFQPDGADLGAAVQLDTAETLDGPAGDADALDAGYVPPDRPYGLDEDGVTAAGMRAGDTLDERLRREEPEAAAAGDPYRSGRLVISDEGTTPGSGGALSGVEVGIDGGAASAEEAAVHDVDADTPVDGEPSVTDDPALADPDLDAAIAAEPGDAERALIDAAFDDSPTPRSSG